jgi:hypothetical protein
MRHDAGVGPLDFFLDWLLPQTRRGWALLAVIVVLAAAAALLAGAILHLF